MARPRMYVLDLGRMHMDKALMIQHWQLATVDQPSPAQQFVEFPVLAYLIAHPDGKILFDTGCNPSAMGPNGRWPADFQRHFPWHGPEECHLPNRLEQLGIGPDDLRYVVLSHLHSDHAGCVEYFKKSRLIVHEDEFAAALSAYALRDKTGSYIWDDIDNWVREDQDWRLVERDAGDLDLNDAVRILNWGSGHARGMLGLHVTLAQTGGIVLTSDAIYCHANYGPPPRMSGSVYDSVGYQKTVSRIKALAERTGSRVWFGHDLQQFATLIPSTSGWYE